MPKGKYAKLTEEQLETELKSMKNSLETIPNLWGSKENRDLEKNPYVVSTMNRIREDIDEIEAEIQKRENAHGS